MNKLITLIVVIVLAVIGYFAFRGEVSAPAGEGAVENTMPVPGTNTEEMVVVKEFTVDASNFAFAPKTLSVNIGDTVRITLKNTQGFHDLKIDEFNAATKTLNSGEEETIEFVADKTGTFEYYCSIGTHRQMGMVGTLVVN